MLCTRKLKFFNPATFNEKAKKDIRLFKKMVTALGLPLLIVKGKFQSLASMSVEDLETFIPFLVKCSVNRAGAQVINGVPEWWASTVPFKFPLQKPRGLSQIGYRKHLSAIVCSCYWYHDAQYLLPFCANIANSPDSVFLQNNEDNTTSIFYVHNTSHIMKFNNENKYYDKKQIKNVKPLRRSLLSTLPKKTVNIPDIYLCENCDGEFSSHSEMQKHEKECYSKIIASVTEKKYKNENVSFGGGSDVWKGKENDGSEEIEILEHIKPISDKAVGKSSFLNYLMLQPKNSECMKKVSVVKNGMRSLQNRVSVDLNVYENRHVEFSSLCGRKILERHSKREIMNKIERNFLVNEYYCSTDSTSRTFREYNELVDFRVTCKKPKRRFWTHQYCFNKKQRRSRYTTLKTGLSERSRKLLKQCREVQVVLSRLNMVL